MPLRALLEGSFFNEYIKKGIRSIIITKTYLSSRREYYYASRGQIWDAQYVHVSRRCARVDMDRDDMLIIRHSDASSRQGELRTGRDSRYSMWWQGKPRDKI